MTLENKTILVIGGGISGITAAVEAAEVGFEVILIEKEAYLGGRVARTYKYFPKMCPPSCGMEINFKRIRNNPRIKVLTLSEVTKITGDAGNFEVSVRKNPRFVTGRTAIPSSVVDKLSSEIDSDFNLGMNQTKALYYPHPMAFPPQYVLDKEALSPEDRAILENECGEGAIDFDQQPEELTFKVGAIIAATGWSPYDAQKMENLGFGRCENVITNVMMERLSDQTGPTQGRLIRPSDQKEIKNIAFAQCAGSRDEKFLPYCSAVCCMGSLKQARYVLEKDPEAHVSIFYIDIRTISRHEKFYYDLLENDRVTFIKGKVAKVAEDPNTQDLLIEAEDSLQGAKIHQTFDLVVLATGVVPNTAHAKIPYEGLQYDEYGFIRPNGVKGIYSAGCIQRPSDVSRCVRQATGAALKAIQCLKG
ncbi:MAG: CoB--CoM heterodisulfide reductase iron-sulfur subunit A family protein [Candidatus Omnitrophica bacterium]|nr:CoB--CoM heterodisulfide reductase iron-sulfur subunit A family protein [Candidatus Omnitrophota bacterium]